MRYSIDNESFRRALEEGGTRKVSFVYHLKVKDLKGYDEWLRESNNSFNSKRLFRVKADPVEREGMLTDEIIIDEFHLSMRLSVFLRPSMKPWIRFVQSTLSSQLNLNHQ